MTQRQRDNQKQKVYDWENDLLFALQATRPDLVVELPLEVCQSFVNKIAGGYGVAPPTVDSHRRIHGNTAFYAHWRRSITLPLGWAASATTVAHEMAHCVTHDLFPNHAQAHGGEFVRVFANILSRFLNIDAAYIEQSITHARLNVLPSSPLARRRTGV